MLERRNFISVAWIEDTTFEACSNIFELLSISFSAVNYEKEELFIKINEKWSFFDFQCISFSVYYFFGMSSYGLESSFFEKFIIWRIF